MAVINAVRPWFKAKLVKAFSGLGTYTAPTVSSTFSESEAQAIANKVEEIVTLLRAGGASV